MRVSIDVGGTFTDLVLETNEGYMESFKSLTSYPNPIVGVMAVLEICAKSRNSSLAEFLGGVSALIHSTTRAINAVVTDNTAKTVLIVSEGHPDSLVLREGGRNDPFDYRKNFPKPYIPRALTFEMPGRIWADGREMSPFNDDKALSLINKIKEIEPQAIAVALIWSVVNPDHEIRVSKLLEKQLPGVPVSLSHRLNPTVREYRRISSCAIDASLKPLMTSYLRDLKTELENCGLVAPILAVTSQGGLVDLDLMAESPILSLNSGPSMAPVAGKHFAELEKDDIAIVTDAGGTTFDVSLVRDGEIPRTRETWVGRRYEGNLTGFPSVDVKSLGAGGGSIASIELGRLLKVGPESSGSKPGPICYGLGGKNPTVTDATVLLGYIDPAFFLGGKMDLSIALTQTIFKEKIADPLGISKEEAALAVLDLATEQMVNAIEDITVKQGIDPSDAVLIAGGGAAGFNAGAIAKRLKCRKVIIPEVGPVLSASGAMISDMTLEFVRTAFFRTDKFLANSVSDVINSLRVEAKKFFDRFPSATESNTRVEFSFEGRYPNQVWEIEVPLSNLDFKSPEALKALINSFHKRHTELYSFRDDGDLIEIMSFRARAHISSRNETFVRMAGKSTLSTGNSKRKIFVKDKGFVTVDIFRIENIESSKKISGPAIIESGYTTVVVPEGASIARKEAGYLTMEL
tara:strand:- start:1861 stop:3924 length:2064 start_codon:yes stop_codon:yes gene_type:complete